MNPNSIFSNSTRHHQALIVLSFLLLAHGSLALEEIVVKPENHQQALINPQMGWTLHYYSNIPTNYGSILESSDLLSDFPGLSTIYLRLPWAYLEPREGEYNWSMVDAPAQRWIDHGLKVAFRFSCSESWMRYATPQWVKAAGAKGYDFRVGAGVMENGDFWEPDYNDPIFLEKHGNFLARAAQRYDGNPHVAFVDVGSFGVWGEGHTFASSGLVYPPETIKLHIDLYRKHFQKTLLAANDDFSFQGEETIQYALDKGLTLRDDSILVQPPPRSYFNAKLAQAFWPRFPVILENEHYGGSKERGAWGDGSLLLKAIEEYHAGYASIHWWPRVFLEEQRDLIDKINTRLGYRIELREAAWSSPVPLDATLSLRVRIANVGVAPCYPGGTPAFTLKDEHDGIVAVCVHPTLNVRGLQVSEPGKAIEREVAWRTFFQNPVKPGTYTIYFSIGMSDGTPTITLPLGNEDGHRRYPLGPIEILPATH
jgi:hypothetical protein